MSLEIIVQNAAQSDAVPKTEKIQNWVQHALGESCSGELTVRVVGESEGVSLNERFRHGSGATNVLAFPYVDTAPVSTLEFPSLGDLIICAPVLEREAADQGKLLEAHWAHISIHGTLHLLGYDHETAEDARVMEARERELLAALGFDDPYPEGV
jgi:probable rRNA maturation factor